MKEKLVLKKEYITLGQLLKAMGLAEDGVMAKEMINDGLCRVNGEEELRRGRKLYDGDIVTVEDDEILVVK